MKKSSGEIPVYLTKQQFDLLKHYQSTYTQISDSNALLQKQNQKLHKQIAILKKYVKKEEPPLEHLSQSCLPVVSKKSSIKMTTIHPTTTPMEVEYPPHTTSTTPPPVPSQELTHLKEQNETLSETILKKQAEYTHLSNLFLSLRTQYQQLEKQIDVLKNDALQTEDKLTIEIDKLKGEIKELLQIKQQKNTKINELEYLIQDVEDMLRAEGGGGGDLMEFVERLEGKIQGRVIRRDYLQKIEDLQHELDAMKTEKETNDMRVWKKERLLKKEVKELEEKVKELEKGWEEGSGGVQRRKKEGEGSSENSSLKGSKEMGKEGNVSSSGIGITRSIR